MLSGMQVAKKNGLVVDRATHTIRFSRELGAPPSQVFEAWTQPEQVTSWWDAEGQPLLICEIDLRRGGSFKFVSKGHRDFPFIGKYVEIAPPDRLVFEAMGAIGRVLLHEANGGTHMVVEIQCQSADRLDQFIKMGVDAGTSQTLDNLVSFINS